MNTNDENVTRAEVYLARKLDFRKIQTALRDHGFITPEELIYYSHFLQITDKKDTANHDVMVVLVPRFLKNHERVALMIKILYQSGYYSTEAYHLNAFLECQKKNSTLWRFFRIVRKKEYFFTDQHTNCQRDEFADTSDNNTLAEADVPIVEQNAIIPQNHLTSIPQEDSNCRQEMEEESQQTSFGKNVTSEKTVEAPGMDSLLEAFERVNVTPMEETDEKVAAVFHQVEDSKDYSDKSNVDEFRVYEIAKRIGVPESAIKGRIKTSRIGKAKDRGTRPLKVKFKDEKTRNSFLNQAKLKSDFLDQVNIVPFVSREKRNSSNFFWKKENRHNKHKNNNK